MTEPVIPKMPTNGVNWTRGTESSVSADGYKYNSSVWNVAWNVLHALGKKDDPSSVAAEARTIVQQYNKDVKDHKIHEGTPISNANVVTSKQLGDLAADVAPRTQFIGPLPPGTARPWVE